MPKSNYGIISEDETVVLIQDFGPWDKYMTVTNNAENVVEEMLPKLKGRRLRYIDSDGEENELMIKNDRFAGFGP